MGGGQHIWLASMSVAMNRQPMPFPAAAALFQRESLRRMLRPARRSREDKLAFDRGARKAGVHFCRHAQRNARRDHAKQEPMDLHSLTLCLAGAALARLGRKRANKSTTLSHLFGLFHCPPPCPIGLTFVFCAGITVLLLLHNIYKIQLRQ